MLQQRCALCSSSIVRLQDGKPQKSPLLHQDPVLGFPPLSSPAGPQEERQDGGCPIVKQHASFSLLPRDSHRKALYSLAPLVCISFAFAFMVAQGRSKIILQRWRETSAVCLACAKLRMATLLEQQECVFTLASGLSLTIHGNLSLLATPK